MEHVLVASSQSDNVTKAQCCQAASFSHEFTPSSSWRSGWKFSSHDIDLFWGGGGGGGVLFVFHRPHGGFYILDNGQCLKVYILEGVPFTGD